MSEKAPSFIIFSSEISKRLCYAAEFIFAHVLNCKIEVTSNIDAFKKSSAHKINYSTINIEGVFTILPHSFIFEKGVNNNFIPKCIVKNELIYLFWNEEKSHLQYDIFSSIFYFVSCYQEWQPFKNDAHQRFEANQSIQFKHNVHLKPIVNYWIEELKHALKKHDNTILFPAKEFKYISTIDVDNLYAYKQKGLVRTIGAIFKDVLTFNFSNLNKRISVLLKKQSDPFDIYAKLGEITAKQKTPLIYFFLQRTGNSFDRTVNPNSNAFKGVFATLTAYGNTIGLHPSYYSSENETMMAAEFEIIRKNSNQEIALSRQHYLRFNIKTTPKQLIKNGVIADFTLGFASCAGYRAGTFTPFKYYDFENETATNLLMVPFAVMDGVYFIYSTEGAAKAQDEILDMAQEAKKLNGIFITVFHERSFDDAICKGFGAIYNNLLTKLAFK